MADGIAGMKMEYRVEVLRGGNWVRASWSSPMDGPFHTYAAAKNVLGVISKHRTQERFRVACHLAGEWCECREVDEREGRFARLELAGGGKADGGE